MKPHVRYGQTAHSMAHTSTPPSSLPVSSAASTRGGGGGNHHSMIEEYKLEEQLAPFYESTASLSARCYGSSSSSSAVHSASANSGGGSGVKPALRTVSIMETLSELTAAGRTSQSQVPTEQQQHLSKNSSASALKNSFPVGTSIVRRKKASSTNVASASLVDDHTTTMSSLLDLQQWYPKRSVPSLQQQQQRVWDVSRLGSKQEMNSHSAATISRKGRSVEDILVSGNSSEAVTSVNGTTTAHGYGSLERRRRRRPGARSGMAVSSSRRVQTDWEQEEDEEDEQSNNRLVISSPVGRRMVESNDHYPVVPPLFPLRSRKTTPSASAASIAHVESPSAAAVAERERERARQSYKPPSEWFTKKKRSPPRVDDVTVASTMIQAHRPRPLLAGGAIKTLRPSNRPYRSSSSGANQERGQTPDWIHQIFQVARRGDLLKLQRALAGMESTLARNLSDHRGNNLLHVVAGIGDADALAWLCSAFGPPMQDALVDENKRGLTPVVAAIQAGHLEALQFLVEHTSVRQRLAPVDGDRSLLHIAAKYGKIDLVAWLAQYMESHALEVDLRDHCGCSPLHLAARAGQASAVAILVAHGADVTAKNDMGHRPLDLASANGHVGVAQLLRLHDAALCLSAEALEATHELDAMRTDYTDLRSHFRDVLVVGKRLAKERDEMCRQLGRLYEDATSVHQGLLLELRTLHRDLAGVRDRVTSSRKAGEIADRNLDESVALVEALHDKWLSQQRGWFSSSLADMEHRLLLAEEGWKRLRTSGAGSSNKHHHDRSRGLNPPVRPHELLRSRLAAVNAQASGMQCDAAALSSSDGSLYSGCCHSECSDHDAAADDEERRNHRESDTVDHRPMHSSMDECLSVLPRSDREPSQWSRGARTTTAPASSRSGKSSSTKEALSDNVYNTLQAAVRKMNSTAPAESLSAPVAAGHLPPKSKLSPMMAGATVERKKAPPPIPPLPPPVSHRREEMRKRLQEVKLTSESGNASVIEVIEPTSSSEDGEDDYGPSSRPLPRDQSTPLRPSSSTSGALATTGARSFNASFTEELEKARQHGQQQLNYAKTTASMNQLHRSAMSEHYGRTTNGKGSSSSLLFAEPDLLAGTVIPTAVTSRSCHDLAVHSMSVGGNAETVDDADANQSRSHSSLSSSNATAVTAVATSGGGRKKSSGGFLTKFALKARWPSKRKANLDAAAASSFQDATSPDLSLEYRDGVNSSTNEDETTTGSNNNSAAGVVAGLSQMFEDLSAKSVKAAVATDNRPSPSRNSFTSTVADFQQHHRAGESKQEDDEYGDQHSPGEDEEEEEVMDLPPSTSPPPVPLEIETYNSMSPSSQETQSSVSGSSSSMQQPPPPSRSSANLSSSKMVDSISVGGGGGGNISGSSSSGGPGSNVTGTGATPSSSASSSTSASHGGVESLSVAASEDSGIVMARPASSASKSDSSPRHLVTSTLATLSPPAASSSVYSFNNNNNNNNNNNLNNFSPLRKASLGGVGLDRLSPAPSDLSKSESASASDLSKTESMRHFRQLARIEEAAAAAAAAAGSTLPLSANEETNKPVGNQLLRMDSAKGGPDETVGHHLQQSSGQILTWREAKLKNQVVTPPPLEERLNKARVRLEEKSIRTLKKRHHVSESRPWYDVSDDESDALTSAVEAHRVRGTPERLTKLKTSLSSSDTASTASSADEDVPV